ncbi:tryptophan-rich sensory protein [Oculatella sp. LEGE 06141]|uniref:tryptophan-rich sensory protein n=1 Tax=Oculatella sp. LEGE 06141 TaxID=1828648 RepID=UPI00187F6EE0|nr:tryptophan-rich sensory protein [Oculatella sp. LEGE 06141]MBE9177746.1 tryptophan-rich sensory protein [Oculatella sp. LEGE 06141]
MKPSTSPSGIDVIRPAATLIAILATLTVNALSNINPPSIGEIANTVLGGVQITPANYAFAIWGLIYLGLIAYGIYQLLPAQRHNATLHRVGYWLILACLAQIAWVSLFTRQQFWLSVLAMLVILGSLIGAYLHLRTGLGRSRQERWLAHIPFSIYLGWIAVATIVNVASALYDSGWNGGMSPDVWTIIMLVVGVIVAAIVILQRADIAFTLVFVWAYVAIAVRQATVPPIWITAVLGAIGLTILLLVNQTRHRRVTNQNELN